MEESLTLGELLLLLSKERELKKQERTFLAALQGVDLNKNEPKEYDPDEIDIESGVAMSNLFGYTEEG
jgi:hypothetical protein